MSGRIIPYMMRKTSNEARRRRNLVIEAAWVPFGVAMTVAAVVWQWIGMTSTQVERDA